MQTSGHQVATEDGGIGIPLVASGISMQNRYRRDEKYNNINISRGLLVCHVFRIRMIVKLIS